MLRALPEGWFSTAYIILENEEPVARIDLAFFTESSDIEVEGVPYKAYRESFLGGAFLLESAGDIIASAEKPSSLSRSFEVDHDGRKYTLEAESVFLRKFILIDGEDVTGEIYPESAFTSRAAIDLPEDIPLPVRIFMFWLVAILWKRDSDAAVSTTMTG